jgi:hypothetical protein
MTSAKSVCDRRYIVRPWQRRMSMGIDGCTAVSLALRRTRSLGRRLTLIFLMKQ